MTSRDAKIHAAISAGTTSTCGEARGAGSACASERSNDPDFINIDLTATKKFGKLEVGPVACGSTDLTHPIAAYRKQGEFAVGGLVGYDFGPVALQAYATTEVAQRNYGGRDTRGWFRLTIPLWTPPAAPQKP